VKVMAFATHPDDEVMCAGTLAKYVAQGHEVAIAFTTNGEIGSAVLGKQEIAAVRKQEAYASTQILGARFIWMNYPDEFLFNCEKVRLDFIDVIRSFDPDIILCPDKEADYHPDHTSTGQIVWDVRVMTTVPNIKTEHPVCTKIPIIYYMDTVAGINFLPDLYVDITSFWEEKKRMLACHESQQGWMVAQYGITHEEFIKTQAMFRGFQAGCRYAEAFKVPKFFPGNTKEHGLLS